MANAWFRLYSEFADDPKVQMMPEAMQRRLVMLFCARCKGETLHETEMAFYWRISEQEVGQTKELFLSKGFIDEAWNVLHWDKRQYLSDSSTSRVRRHRSGRKQDETFHETPGIVTTRKQSVTVTAPDTDTDTEQKQSRTEEEDASPPIEPSMVARAVLEELALSGNELLYTLTDVCRLEMKQGTEAEALRDRLVQQHRLWTAAKPKLQITWGAVKFFGEGHWREADLWPWKEGHAPAKAPDRSRYVNGKRWE